MKPSVHDSVFLAVMFVLQECKISLYLVTSDTIFILEINLHLKKTKM